MSRSRCQDYRPPPFPWPTEVARSANTILAALGIFAGEVAIREGRGSTSYEVWHRPTGKKRGKLVATLVVP